MKILIFADARSIHTRRWAEALRDKGHSIYIATFREQAIEGVNVYVVGKNVLGKLGYLSSLGELKLLYKNIKPDIVHAHYATSYGVIAAFANLHPLIITAWGSDVLISPKKSFLSRMLLRYAFKHADSVTCVADHMIEPIIELGCKREKVRSITMGIDIDDYPIEKDKKPVPPPYRIISTRSFEKIYDVSTLLEAGYILYKQGVDIRIILVGTGSLENALERKAVDLGIKQIVSFEGKVSFSKLKEMLGSSHFFVSTSISDGNNISLNEAMVLGCYPIATDIAANRQWIQHGLNGLLYKCSDAVELAEMIKNGISSIEGYTDIAQSNRKMVIEKASWKNCVVQMNKLYESILNCPKGKEK